MPFVRVELFEGRTQEQKNQLARDITEAVLKNTTAPKSAIHVFINDMKEGTYFPEGEMKKVD
ncbi:4-oxalocrotonate tautomerase [Pseudolactococcus hodotermopsidis]|nr:4-oxalocrotonate tautomerase [Lactococcus hodotermopsidis]